jgi:hypothetical protein
MGEDTKKLRQELSRQINARLPSVEIKVLHEVVNFFKSPKKFSIEKVATFSGTKNIETQKFIISFEHLNLKECEFEQFDSTKGKKVFQIFETVSRCEVKDFPAMKLIRDSIDKSSGVYFSLFSKLTDDVTKLHETECCGGRIFFFIIEPYFYIVSIETKHRNIDK